MPRGGPRPNSGRPRGPSKATIKKIEVANIREQIAATQVAETKARAANLKLAKEEMEEFLPILKGTVGQFKHYAIGADGSGAPGKPNHDPEKWETLKSWMEFYVSAMDKLADFQSPKFKAIAVTVPQPQRENGPRLIDEFDKAVRIGNSGAASQAYLQLMKAPRQLALPPLPKRSAV